MSTNSSNKDQEASWNLEQYETVRDGEKKPKEPKINEVNSEVEIGGFNKWVESNKMASLYLPYILSDDFHKVVEGLERVEHHVDTLLRVRDYFLKNRNSLVRYEILRSSYVNRLNPSEIEVMEVLLNKKKCRDITGEIALDINKKFGYRILISNRGVVRIDVEGFVKHFLTTSAPVPVTINKSSLGLAHSNNEKESELTKELRLFTGFENSTLFNERVVSVKTFKAGVQSLSSVSQFILSKLNKENNYAVSGLAEIADQINLSEINRILPYGYVVIRYKDSYKLFNLFNREDNSIECVGFFKSSVSKMCTLLNSVFKKSDYLSDWKQVGLELSVGAVKLIQKTNNPHCLVIFQQPEKDNPDRQMFHCMQNYLRTRVKTVYVTTHRLVRDWYLIRFTDEFYKEHFSDILD